MKKSVAIWVPGGIGTGHFSQGHPALEKLILKLSDSYLIKVYSYAPPNQAYVSGGFELFSAPRFVPGTFRRLWLICRFPFDHYRKRYHYVLSFWGFPGGFLVTLLGKIFSMPSAICIMGGDAAGIPSINYGIFHRALPRKLAAWAYRSTTTLISLSKYSSDNLIQFGITRPTEIVPLGVDQNFFVFTKKPRDAQLRCLHVGHLSPVKDQTTLIKAFAAVSRRQPARLRILGVDTMNGSIQDLCNQAGIRSQVEFVGMVPHKEMRQHYDWADIMIHTSLSEGQGQAYAEAAASGVLLAGTNVGMLYDLGEACGLIVERGDHAGLSEKILAIVQSPAAWESKVQGAKKWSAEHDDKWTVRTFRNIIDRDIEKHFHRRMRIQGNTE